MKHLVFILGLSAAVTLAAQSQQPPPAAFQIEEATIAQIHAAMRAGRLTCRGLVEQYLKRIEAYDKTGPAINAIVVVNPDALAQADAMDRLARQGTFSGPLFCIPTIVKDNFETIGLQTTVGSLSLAGLRAVAGRVPGEAHQGGRSDRPCEVEHGGVRVHAVRDRQLDSSRLHEESVRARSRHRRIERRHRGSRGCELRRDWPGKRHGQLHPWTGITSGAGRHPLDDGADEPRRCRPAEPAGRHRGADDADARRCRHRAPGHRGSRSGRSGDGTRHADRA